MSTYPRCQPWLPSPQSELVTQPLLVPAQYKGIGVRIEDNLLMTEYGNKNLTAAAPKEIDDIENLMKN